MKKISAIEWTTLTAAIISAIVGAFAWLFPNAPPPFSMERLIVYNVETPIAKASGYVNADAGFVPIITIRIEDASPLYNGQVIGFNGARCVVQKIEAPGTLIKLNSEPPLMWPHAADITCQILGGGIM